MKHMIFKNIIATTELDAHGQQIPEDVLFDMAENINNSPSAIKYIVGHDSTILPIGKIIYAEIIELPNGHKALQATIDRFLENFKKCEGPNGEIVYIGKSELDNRPFVEYDNKNHFELSINPLNFSKEDFYEIVDYIKNETNIKINPVIKKSLIPEPELVLHVVSGLILMLVTKKSIDKIADKISEDVASVYDKIKEIILKVSSKIKDGKTITYIISEQGQPIELVVRTAKTEILFDALDSLKDNSILKKVNLYSNFFDSPISKIQFIYNSELSKWDVNFATTITGESIGSEKCYMNAVELHAKTLESPSVGFSIGSSING